MVATSGLIGNVSSELTGLEFLIPDVLTAIRKGECRKSTCFRSLDVRMIAESLNDLEKERKVGEYPGITD
jgi:hypothetical protein